jgi:rubrerythrin
MPRRTWSRRDVLIGGAAVAVTGVAIPEAAADDETDEALLRLGASAELVATAFYTRALGSRRFDRRERESLLRARFADQRHYSRLVSALGPGAPAVEDLDVRLPSAAFRSRTATVELGLRIERAIAGFYVEAAATVEAPARRALVASLAASEATHVGALAALAGGVPLAPPLPASIDVERATELLAPCWG